ncbi:MAG: hypothetical protein UU47_C0004G0043 [candidate division TM6 bacterium GW2011_GWE2_41_16]|nr:MAG: hypothetical protein UU47_C0004G0043 [candidate division TM6 bacterium GW2011_GWE2_41_16]
MCKKQMFLLILISVVQQNFAAHNFTYGSVQRTLAGTLKTKPLRKNLPHETKEKLIIDTDLGFDDALAIMYLGKTDKFDIKAITTVAGNFDIQATTNNALYVLDFLGQQIPVYSGSSAPIEQKKQLAFDAAGQENFLLEQPKKELGPILHNAPLTNNAAAKIVELVRAYPHHITILAIGPQSNIAEAFKMAPDLPSLVKRIVFMGGAIDSAGNTNRVAEFNIFLDPMAAYSVLTSSVTKVMVPLDICNTIPFDNDVFSALRKKNLIGALDLMRERYITKQSFNHNRGIGHIYDPIAAYYLVHPEAFILTPMDIVVETRGIYTNGMTVADKRSWGNKKNNIIVATHVDQKTFLHDFMCTLFEQ